MALRRDRTLLVASALLACGGAFRLRPAAPPWPRELPSLPKDELKAAAERHVQDQDAMEMMEVLDDAPVVPLSDKEMKELEEKDMEIYRRHWAPFDPPPYHHPTYYPSWPQMHELQALAENYTKYWRSLPKYSVSPLVHEVQKYPYFKLSNWSNYSAKLRLSEPEKGMENQLLFVCHHKAGVTLRGNIQRSGLPAKFEYHSWYEPAPEDLEGQWPSNLRIIHFVRDPIDLILSGYRYHERRWGAETWSWGRLKLQDPPCFDCDDADHKVLFDTCSFNCTYFELLNRVNETSGVALEAVSARTTLTSMAAFMSLQAENKNTLHLSIKLLKNHADQMAGCVLRFLGFGDRPELRERLAHSVGEVADPQHITAGAYNNSQLRAFLEEHPGWGPDFRALSSAMNETFHRQSQRWGCPASEEADLAHPSPG